MIPAGPRLHDSMMKLVYQSASLTAADYKTMTECCYRAMGCRDQTNLQQDVQRGALQSQSVSLTVVDHKTMTASHCRAIGCGDVPGGALQSHQSRTLCLIC